MRVAVLADTHIRDVGRTALPDAGWDILRTVDVILHAGDITGRAFLARLCELGPVHAVRGNNDVDLERLPESCELELEQVRIAMIHDSGPRRGREARMHDRFPGADVVVFGHSHVPWDAPGIDGQHLFNPGSATQRRSQPLRTMGLLTCEHGRVHREIVPLH